MQTGGFNFDLLVYRQETSDTTPTVTGLAAFTAGTSLIVTVGGAQYTATVQSDQTWSITTGTLSAGWYDVQIGKASTDQYVTSGGDGYRRADGSSLIYRPGGTSWLFSDVLYIIYDYWVFHDGSGGYDTHVWSL